MLHPDVVIFSLASLDPPLIDKIEHGRRQPIALPPLPNLGPLKAAPREP
jgi:hypothetical protein